jgi:hypothetical protein
MSGLTRPDKPVLSLNMSFGHAPTQVMVTPLCQSLCELCRPVLLDDNAAARLRLIAHELLENVVKYSSPGSCEFRFELWQSDQGTLRAHVQTTNTPASEHREEAEQRFRALSEAHDPLAHYDAVIADRARRPAGTGLGLARIHAETEYRLSHRFEEQRLVIVAMGDVVRNQTTGAQE